MAENVMGAVFGRRVKRALAVCIALLGVHVGAAGTMSAKADAAPDGASASDLKKAAKTLAYVETFYPLWFTDYQFTISSKNRMIGPVRISPIYKAIVAINVDTLYASTVMSLESEPVVINLPSTDVTYSILVLDAFGNVYDTDIEAEAGTYILTGPDYTGTIPHGLNEVEFPINYSMFIIRADNYSATGEDNRKKARKFRRNITTQTLSQFQAGDTPESTKELPEAIYGFPFKAAADALIEYTPIEFLKMLQKAVASEFVPELSKADQKLSDDFDDIFNEGSLSLADRLILSAAVKEAKTKLQDNYTTPSTSTNWTHFNNIGDWGDAVIDRASITEFCQYCNTIDTAAYYHAFYDKKGKALDGKHRKGYVLKFGKKQIPDVSRFWSLTAYTPETVELIDNDEDKYAVASYTPKLKYNANGSVSIYIARKKPAGVRKANWLPVSGDQFNVMLRLYGPEGDVESYEPPAIRKR